MYLYIESDPNRNKGHKAVLSYTALTPIRDACFSMYYHMYGSHAGTINVKTKGKTGNALATVWTETGTQGDRWLKMEVGLKGPISQVNYMCVNSQVNNNCIRIVDPLNHVTVI